MAELAHHFLFLFNRELGLNIQGFDPEVLACLREHRWSGNVRELQAVLKEAMLRTAKPLRRGEHLYYYQVMLKGTTEATLCRYQASHDPAKSRSQVAAPLTHETLARVLADLAGE